MSSRRDVPPDTIGVELGEAGVTVTYTDGRSVLYRGVPTAVSDAVRTPPAKEVHVLVTDETETRGILVYVNDRNTHGDVLEDTGVGRVMLREEADELFPGVVVREEDMRIEVEADPDLVDGRVFVFVEDEFGEQSFEIVSETDD